MKSFDDWNILKKELENRNTIYVSERDIWFCSVGINVGSEQDGKHELFERPVLVLKKVSLNTFIGLPLTSIKKKGSWYVEIKSTNSSAIIPQIRLFDTKRLTRKIGVILIEEFENIRYEVKKYI
ncbi:MAG: type II toxin-antitoxin system PemK/MazF family toxin [Candidatus Nomurabacteria bacterium]|nr:type II toxin-antitoxin system PemK/MazF family toxin [Candidatus Nomurabacteria bacterium]